MNTLTSLFASRSRRHQFEANITIESLTDIPLVFGRFYVRWKLRNALNDSRGVTQSIPIIDHTVVWNNSFTIKTVLVAGKDGLLLPCDMSFNIKKEVQGGKKSESIGRVDVDLAEFAGSKFMTRQYLLQQSKMNSSLKISIDMKQINGETMYKAPEDKKYQTQAFKQILKGNEEATQMQQTMAEYPLFLLDAYESETGQSQLIDEIFAILEEKERELMKNDVKQEGR